MQARAAVALAAEEARAAGHTAVGTEHILLGVLHAPESFAGRALSTLAIELAPTRHLVTSTLGSAEPTEGLIPFTSAASRALELAESVALDRGRGAVEPEDILLALVAEPGNGAARILLELDVTPEDVRSQLDDLAGEPADTRRLARWPGLEQDIAEGELEVGWRGRAIALAALGAAVLGRSAFDARRTRPLTELEMQLLVYLALGLEADPAEQASRGEAVESLPAALACDHQELVVAVDALRREQLVVRPELVDEGERVAITPAGVARVEQWLRRAVPLFGGWPPEHTGVDDATG
jgi:Clp amino terminal domain, pathogenicity island component